MQRVVKITPTLFALFTRKTGNGTIENKEVEQTLSKGKQQMAMTQQNFLINSEEKICQQKYQEDTEKLEEEKIH